MGAALASRLAQSLLKVLNVNRTFFWTDSENVWYWVHNQSRDFKPFVANRVGEIHRITNPEQWHHVPGKDNPADLATRGMTAVELNDSTFWAEGPTFLKKLQHSVGVGQHPQLGIQNPLMGVNRESTPERMQLTFVSTYRPKSLFEF